MRTSCVKNGMVVGIILLFIGVAVQPSIAVDNVKQSSMPTSNGKTLYVGGSGEGNYTKIQDALDDANEGDTVFVFEDSSPYYEHIEIDKYINLIGENRETTVIDGDGSYTVVWISANRVTVSGFTIQGSGFASYYGFGAGIQIGSNSNTIIGNTFSNNRYAGISLYYFSNNNITGNYFSNNDFYGIEMYNTHDNTITGNTFSKNNNYGIELKYSSNNNITGNYFSKDDISLEDSNDNIISDNSFFNDGLYVSDSYENTVFNNTVNGKPLVYLEDKFDITIGKAGQVILINCDNITIQNQEISHTNIGIQLLDTHNCRIYHNTISYNQLGIDFFFSHSNIIQKNNFLLNMRHASFWESWRNRWRQNYWNRPRILPKLIFSLFSGFNIDWRPALLPYDIEVVI